jgi:hypothetical protein
MKSGDESKEAKKAEAEAAFQAWLDRKRAVQRKEKMGVIGRQVSPNVPIRTIAQSASPRRPFSDVGRSSIVTAARRKRH